MKTLQPATLAIINNNYGAESVCIVEVQWVDDGQWNQYADKDFQGIPGVVNAMGTIESIVKMDSQGQSQQVILTLSDVSGNLKDVINNNDIHGRTVRIYQLFEGLPIGEKFQLFEGQINSPISWKEGDRTLTFTVTTKLEDKEIGFSPEEGNFPYIPDHLIGKAWPLAFGTVENIPGAHLKESATCESLNPVYLEDPEAVWQGLSEISTDFFLRQIEFDWDAYVELSEEEPWLSQEERYKRVVNQTEYTKAQMGTMHHSELLYQRGIVDLAEAQWGNNIYLSDGSNFPQGTPVYLILDRALFYGTVTGDTFVYTSKERLDYNRVERWSSFNQSYLSYDTTTITYIDLIKQNTPDLGLMVVDAGTEVRLAGNDHVTYVANLLPSTILHVKAYRDGKLVLINPRHWTSSEEALGGYNIQMLTLLDPPVELGYDSNDVYITLTSTVGPNTITIMEWLIDTYTDLSYDATEFALATTQLENYPSHFAFLDRKNIMQVLEEMAFQSRCAIWIQGGTFHVKYLSKEVDSVVTLTESDIEANSLELKTTSTEDLVTKFIAEWRRDYAANEKNSVILRHNVAKYGSKERVFDFYIYNIKELVVKSATFWIIRYANVWKELSLTTYLHKLATECFDTVLLDFDSNFVAETDVKSLVTGVSYNSKANEVQLDLWVPVKFGTMEQYDFTWPHDISVELKFPTSAEKDAGLAGGDGPGAEIQGYLDLHDNFTYGNLPNVLNGGMTTNWPDGDEAREEEERNREDHGERTPSDLDDTKPEPAFSREPVYNEVDPPMYYVDPVTGTTVPVEAEDEVVVSKTYPGYVSSYEGEGIYAVVIYRNGLNGEGDIISGVKQLQLAAEEAIPNGTGVMVTYNTYLDPEGDGETDVLEEWTMQVAVWL